MIKKCLTLLSFTLVCQFVVLQQIANAELNIVRNCKVIETKKDDVKYKPPVLTALAVQSDSQRFATAGDDHIIRVWSMDGKMLKEISGHSDWIRCMSINPMNHALASAGDDRTVRFWNTETGKQTTMLGPLKHAIYSMSYSPDGKLLAVAGFSDKVKIYDTATKKLLSELEAVGKDIRTVMFSPDGKLLAAGSRTGVLAVWKVSDGSLKYKWNAHRRRIRSVAFSLDSNTLISTGEDRKITVWNLQNGKLARTIACKTAKIMTLRFLTNNTIVAAGSDNAIHQWELATGSHVSSFLGHKGSVTAIECNADQTIMISTSFDTTIRVWRLSEEEKNGTTTKRERFDSTNQ